MFYRKCIIAFFMTCSAVWAIPHPQDDPVAHIIAETAPALPQSDTPDTAASPPPSIGRVSGLPIPRYVSLKAPKAYLRRGPDSQQPVLWTYIRKGIPLEIIDEFENWRHVRDIDGVTGWLNQRLLSGTRTGLVYFKTDHPTSDQHLLVSAYKTPNAQSHVVAQLEKGVILPLTECQTEWCYARHPDFKGWISKKYLWGVSRQEIFQE